MIDQNTAEGKALQAVVKLELKNYLGKDYNDDVLPLYIVVMLAHGNQQPLVAENLEAFLGQEKAGAFSIWLFKHLAEHPGKYDAFDPTADYEETRPESAAEPEAAATEAEPPAGEDASRKRRRDKREKIEWKGEPEAGILGKHREKEERDREHREEKRRRSGDRERADREPRDREREEQERPRERGHPRAAPSDRWEHDDRSRYDEPVRKSRHRELDREREREKRADRHERSRRREHERDDDYARRPDAWEDGGDRREGRSTKDRLREDVPRDFDRPLRITSRLAGRLGEPSALPRHAGRSRSGSPAPMREDARPSVFDRLNRPSVEAKEEDPSSTAKPESKRQSKLRMDTVPAALTDRITEPSSEPPSPALLQPTVSMGAPEEVALELRQIKETLAKMQAEKMRHASTVVASNNLRKAVVHNVHFNATPDILKAHFSGCGSVVSAIIEKDPLGNPKGLAMIEFEEESARKTALTLSGSMLIGRPITVYPKESAPAYASAAVFKPRAPAPTFRPRAVVPGRGRAPGRAPGRGVFPGRTTLKNNKYVRPQVPQAAGSGDHAKGAAANGLSVQAET